MIAPTILRRLSITQPLNYNDKIETPKSTFVYLINQLQNIPTLMPQNLNRANTSNILGKLGVQIDVLIKEFKAVMDENGDYAKNGNFRQSQNEHLSAKLGKIKIACHLYQASQEHLDFKNQIKNVKMAK
ncbi:hypothetical protein [Providencia sneebia]|uniref:Uncharacterized protein n=1 Tax=Providencia sneebia DSM 19967 TaxID=1141660 RepID=K8WLJ6_9GAMM|nr:hypothetical protein [Providencia sneebia]EKT58342.1 hypothetical protein OO7_06459 [Providencia sneebia DSM 19967]